LERDVRKNDALSRMFRVRS